MHSTTAVNSVKKFIHICNKNHILNAENIAGVISLQYGPLGSLLKRNIFNEWFNSFMNSSEIKVFPKEILCPRRQTFLLKQGSEENSRDLLQDAIGTYFEIHSRYGCHVPFGLALYGPCINKDNLRKESFDFTGLNYFSDLEAWTRMSVIFFYPPKKPMNSFHFWSKQRYLWWRKYSSEPSKFSMSDVTVGPTNGQQLSLLLEYPWGKGKLETITLHDNKFVEELCQKYSSQQTVSNIPTSWVPAIVTCETELDLAVIAYLSNSYAEKWRDNKNKNVLHLHYKLAPYKVCLTLEESDSEHLKKLRSAISHLTKELKDCGIHVLPESDSSLPSLILNEFEKYDEMGIPYVIVLNENSLQTGIACLRNRDTTLQEQVHISELPSKLLKYLKIKR